MDMTADVIVVGAGLAGLKAAHVLQRSGRTVIVVEAKDHVGGRLKQAPLDGRAADLGGQWVGPRHTMLLEEAKLLGIETYPQYTEGKTLLQLEGKLVSFKGDVPKMPVLALLELFRLQRRWDREMRTVPAETPWLAPRAKEWDSQTLESWIMDHVRTRHARAFARLVPRGAWAVDASQISYLWFLDALRSGEGLESLMSVKNGVLEFKFKGGMHQIAARLAEELGERVVLSAPVEAMVQTGDGVTVRTAKGAFDARFAIVAAPPAALAHIRFEPGLPTAREGLNQRMPMGNIFKIVVGYRTPFWREKGFSGQVATDDDTLGIVMDDVQEVGPPVLLAFIEGERALRLSGADPAERKKRVIASLVRFFGPEAAEPLSYVENDWNVEPYTLGYVGHMAPGTMTRFGHALREPVGRIHWAGAETAVEWQGYIEGAARSGARAAEEVLRRDNG